LATTTESDLTSIRGFGKKSLVEVRDKLVEHGLELKPPKGGVRASIDLLDDDDDDDF
jgi:DNA-directed RNA polymerase subunit alpha